MKKIYIFLALIAFVFAGCSDDDKGTERFGVSFLSESVNVADATTPVKVVFNTGMPASGFVTISYTATNVVYGTDFTTDADVVNGVFTLPFTAGDKSIQFDFNKLTNATEGEVKHVVFTITQISLAQVEITGNKSIQLNFNEMPSMGGQASPTVGGSNEPNQVYFDLSTGQYTERPRSSWDLGFYSGGDSLRVVINGSVGMAVKQLNTTNIDMAQSSDVNVAIGTFDPLNEAYIDSPDGLLAGTAIAEVSPIDSDNKVYLVNMGYGVPTTPAATGSVSVAGAHRGWKKIRVLKNGESGYTLQYADANATTHTEVAITKDQAYNFTFFSLVNGTTTPVEPQKALWDLNFTTFTNIIEGSGSYFYSDFVISNTKGGTRAYQVATSATSYDNFTLANVDAASFDTTTANDQRAIGANWRNVIPIQLYTDRFYIIKDPAGNIYKLRFTAMVSQQGDRGYPVFQYALLQ